MPQHQRGVAAKVGRRPPGPDHRGRVGGPAPRRVGTPRVERQAVARVARQRGAGGPPAGRVRPGRLGGGRPDDGRDHHPRARGGAPVAGRVAPAGGTVITGDAMFTQPDVCAAVQERGGDYILYAKSNQGTLCTDLEAAFATAAGATFPPGLPRQWDRDAGTACEVSQGHGWVERRTVTTTTWLNEYLTRWPGVQQVFRLTRTRQVGGKTTVEVVYGISSLSSVDAAPDALLRYTRTHWGIESRHHIRDATLGEDRCRVRRGAAPRVLAVLRNVAVYLLRHLGTGTIAAVIRTVGAKPELALAAAHQPVSVSE
ncbi:ISAs1 family transposase [Gemmata obscuriglobus]|uniref:ISAs1 family transposase n=1 Tax=Gemmata obscuriglobus TaxID=114 RepID=UPI003AABD1A0